MISAALDGKLDDVTWTKHEYFQIKIFQIAAQVYQVKY